MQLQFSIVLNRRRDDVWRAFDRVDSLKKWQPTLVSFEPQSGTPGEVGAISKLTYLENNRTIVLTEVVTLRQPPREFAGTYDSGMAINHVHNRFEELGDGTTQWTMTAEFRFTGLWKLLSPLFRGMIKKRLQADAQRFRELLEAGELDPQE